MDLDLTAGVFTLAVAFGFLPSKSLAQEFAVPDEFIVKLKESALKDVKALVSNESFLSLALGAQVKERFHADKRLLLVSKRIKSKNMMAALNELSQNELVEYVEPNYIYKVAKASNDPDLSRTWGIKNVGQRDKEAARPGDPLPPQLGLPGVDVNAEQAWDISTGSRQVVVAVLDTGVDVTHPELAQNMWVNEKELRGKAGVDDDGNGLIDDIYGYNFVDNKGDVFDDNSHGTHCAGIIGASGNDGVGVSGVAWNVRIMAVKFLSDQATGSLSNAIKAIDYAEANGAQIINSSWAGPIYSEALREAIERASKKSILFVAAAGNDGDDTEEIQYFPVSYNSNNLISVAAIDNRGELAYFSNYGKTDVHVGAPGANIYSTLPGNKYGIKSGTSMAAPYVSGVAALLKAQYPEMSAIEMKARIILTAQPLKSLKGITASGGRVDAFNALTNKLHPSQ